MVASRPLNFNFCFRQTTGIFFLNMVFRGDRMSGLRTLARLQPSERRLILSSLFVVIVIRIALWVLPFLRLQRSIRSRRSRWYLPFPVPPDTPVARLVWAVRAASRRVPMASCLTQSLALQLMLARAGHPSQLRIGIHKDLNTGFHAHAWVDWAGTTLLSTPSELERYILLFSSEESRA
jgi:hypothetical protein